MPQFETPESGGDVYGRAGVGLIESPALGFSLATITFFHRHPPIPLQGLRRGSVYL